MRKIQSLHELEAVAAQVVIINCGTKWVTSLALLSALRHTTCPVLVIDCESADHSEAHFKALAEAQGLKFDWLSWPLRPHPVALDELFSGIPAASVLLMDSDLEILKPDLWHHARSALNSDPRHYGAGFVHGPCWIESDHGLPPYTGYYAERMWIPFVLLRTEVIRRALRNGSSFMNRRPYLEIPGSPRLSRFLSYRFRLKGLRHLPPPRISGTSSSAEAIDGHHPKFIEYDTGADLHASLLGDGYGFAGLPTSLWGDVSHHHGVTRARLANFARLTARRLKLASGKTETPEIDVLTLVKERLRTQYAVPID